MLTASGGGSLYVMRQEKHKSHTRKRLNVQFEEIRGAPGEVKNAFNTLSYSTEVLETYICYLKLLLSIIHNVIHIFDYFFADVLFFSIVRKNLF